MDSAEEPDVVVRVNNADSTLGDAADELHRFSRIKSTMNTMCAKILNPYQNVKSYRMTTYELSSKKPIPSQRLALILQYVKPRPKDLVA